MFRQQRGMAKQNATLAEGCGSDLPWRGYGEIAVPRQEGANLVAILLRSTEQVM